KRALDAPAAQRHIDQQAVDDFLRDALSLDTVGVDDQHVSNNENLDIAFAACDRRQFAGADGGDVNRRRVRVQRGQVGGFQQAGQRFALLYKSSEFSLDVVGDPVEKL